MAVVFSIWWEANTMKLLYNAGSFLLLVFVALALFNLSSVARFRTDVAISIWTSASALALSFGLYAVYLRQRIAALEKQLQALK
jgi:hypothetical protein